MAGRRSTLTRTYRAAIVLAATSFFALGAPVAPGIVGTRAASAVAACEDPLSLTATPPATERISATAGAADGNAGTGSSSISADGRYIAFASSASNLIGGDGDFAGAFSSAGRMRSPDGAIQGSTTLSVEAWFKTTQSGPIFSMANSNTSPTSWVDVLYVDTNGKLRGSYWTGQIVTLTSTASVNDGKWHHAALTGAVNTQSLYLDGALIGTRSGAINHAAMTANWVGYGYRTSWPSLGTGWGSFEGRLDEAAIYRSALSPATILAHYQARTTSYKTSVLASSPWGYWRLSDTGGSAADASGNGRTGAYGGPGYTSGMFGALTVDQNDESDVFLRDRLSQTVTRLSVGTGGIEGASWSQTPKSSADGRFVAFTSNASNLVAGDSNGRADVFVRDNQTGATTLVSKKSDGSQVVADAWRPAVATDGTNVYVVFETSGDFSGGLDTNGDTEPYLRQMPITNLASGTTTRIALNSSGAAGDVTGQSYTLITRPGISYDGLIVAFASRFAQIAANDSNANDDVFVRDRALNTTTRISNKAGGLAATGQSYHPAISGDGRFVSFYSDATDMTTPETSGTHAFLFDRSMTSIRDLAAAGTDSSISGPSLSGDGRYVAFRSTAALVTDDTNGNTDIFLKDQSAGELTRVSVNTANAQGVGDSFAPSVSGDGRYVSFESAASLVASDGNATFDEFVRDRGLGGLLRMAASGLAPKAQSDELGLEQFYPYRQFGLGSAKGYAHLRTGNVVVQQTDLEVPAQGLNVVVKHTYNSGRQQEDVGLGRGWTLSVGDVSAGVDGLEGQFSGLDVNKGIVVDPIGQTLNGAFQAAGLALEFTDGDGTTHRFVRSSVPCGSWSSPPGVNLRIREHANSVTGLVDAFELIRPDGVTYRAEPDTIAGLIPTRNWRVVSVTDRRGNQLNYGYASSGSLLGKPRIDSISHNRYPSETLAKFTYLGESLQYIKALPPPFSAVDPASGITRNWERRTKFSVNPTTRRLDSVLENEQATTQQGQRTTAFAYWGNGRMSAVWDPRGHPTGLFYNTDGTLQKTTDRAAKAWTYSYQAGENGDTTTTATAPVDSTTTSSTTYRISPRTSLPDGRFAGGNILEITDAGHEVLVRTHYEWTANRLTKSTDAAGQESLLSYDDLGLVTEVSRPAPNTADEPLTPNVEIEDPVVAKFEYTPAPGFVHDAPDAEGPITLAADLTRSTAADGIPSDRRITDFTYDAVGNMTASIQRANPDPSVPSTSPPGPGDRATQVTYYDRGAIETVDGPRTDVNDVTTWGDSSDQAYGGYDRTGQPLTIADAKGHSETFAYTPYGLIGRATDRDGRVDKTAYDERDNPTVRTDAGNHVRTYEFDANNNQVKMTQPSGGTHFGTWAYDANDRLTDVSAPGLNPGDPPIAVQTSYFDDGSTKSVENALGNATFFEYWPNRLLKREDAPADGVERAVTDHYYDSVGREIRKVSPPTNGNNDQPEVRTTYNPDGSVQRIEQTSADGDRTTSFAYNALGDQTAVVGPRADAAGYKQATRMSYDHLGQVTSRLRRKDANTWLSTATTYDLAGNVETVSQPTGDSGPPLITSYDYDVLNRLVSQTDPSNPGHIIEYSYTDQGLQEEKIDKTDGTEFRRVVNTFNPDRSLATSVATRGSQALALCNYDPTNTGGPASGYDVDGNLMFSRTIASADCGSTSLVPERQDRYSYNERGWTKTVEQAVKSPQTGQLISRTQSFTYKSDGQMATATHQGLTTAFTYSPAGWLTKVTDWRSKETTSAYFRSGALKSRGVGSGVATGALDWTADGLLRSVIWRKSTAGPFVRQHSLIEYDDGLRTSEDVSVLQPGGTVESGAATYDYDLLGRLTEFTSPFVDAQANDRLKTALTLFDDGTVKQSLVTRPSGSWRTMTGAYASGRLTSQAIDEPPGVTDHVESFQYDGIGQETERRTTPQGGTSTLQRTATYDPLGHPIVQDDKAEPSPNDDVTYAYDALDHVLSRAEPNAPSGSSKLTLYFYWGNTRTLAEETDGTGGTLVNYVPSAGGATVAQLRFTVANGARDATDTSGEWRWLLSDSSGSTAATLVKDDGEVAEQQAWDPYGVPQAAGSSETDPHQKESSLGYKGQLTDPSTGYELLGPRQYDPTTARFTTADSFVAASGNLELGRDELSGNRYIFAGANPVALFEDGHTWCTSVQRRYGCRPSGGGTRVGAPSVTAQPLEFDIPIDNLPADAERVRIDLWIAHAEAGPPFARLSGDNRGANPNAGLNQSRAVIEIRPDKGVIHVRVNPSCDERGRCRDALQQGLIGGNTVSASVAGSSQVMLAWRLKESRYPILGIAPTIDGQMTIDFDRKGRASVRYASMDGFPSVRVYAYRDPYVYVLYQQDERSFWDLYGFTSGIKQLLCGC